MTYSEEMKLVLGSILEYAKLNELTPEEVFVVFNEGLLHYARVPLVNPLPSEIKQHQELDVEALKLKKQELEETLKWIPTCEKGKRDETLDQILEINEKIRKHDSNTYPQ